MFLIYKSNTLVPQDSFWLSHTKVAIIIMNFLSKYWHLSNTTKTSAQSISKREITSNIEGWKPQVQANPCFLKFKVLDCLHFHCNMLFPLTRILKTPMIRYFAVTEFKILRGWNSHTETCLWPADLFLWLTMWFKKIEFFFFKWCIFSEVYQNLCHSPSHSNQE